MLFTINILILLKNFLGALGCRFFSKRKIPRETPNEHSMILKLYVGAKLIIDNFQFVLVDIEDRTLRFMMDHPKEVCSQCNNTNISFVITH